MATAIIRIEERVLRDYVTQHTHDVSEATLRAIGRLIRSVRLSGYIQEVLALDGFTADDLRALHGVSTFIDKHLCETEQ